MRIETISRRRMRTAPYRLAIGLAGVMALAGCGTESSFFRVRNPFDSEAGAIADWKTRSQLKREKSAKPEPLPEPPPSDPAPAMKRDAYFGRGGSAPEGDLPFLAREEASPEKPAVPAPAPSSEAARSAPPPPDPVPLSRKETVTAPRPPATGAVCYRCNGKGRHLTSLAPDGRLVECTDCGGTGRK